MNLRLPVAFTALVAAGCFFDSGGSDPSSLVGFPPVRAQRTVELGPFALDSIRRGVDTLPTVNPTRLAVGDREGLSHEVFLEFRPGTAKWLRRWANSPEPVLQLLLVEDSTFYAWDGFQPARLDSSAPVPFVLSTSFETSRNGTDAWTSTVDSTWAQQWRDSVRAGVNVGTELTVLPSRSHKPYDSLWVRLPDSLFHDALSAYPDSIAGMRVRMRLSTDGMGKVLRLLGSGYSRLPRLVFSWRDTTDGNDTTLVWTVSAWKTGHVGVRSAEGDLVLQAGIRDSLELLLPQWIADSLLGDLAGKGVQQQERVLLAELVFPYDGTGSSPETDLRVPLVTYSVRDTIDSLDYTGGMYAESYKSDTNAVKSLGQPYLLGMRDSVRLQVTGTVAHIVGTGGSARPRISLRVGSPFLRPTDAKGGNYYDSNGDLVRVVSDQPEFGRYDLSILQGANLHLRVLMIEGGEE